MSLLSRRPRSGSTDRDAPGIQVGVPDVVALSVGVGAEGVRLLGLTPCDGVDLRFVRTDPRQRSTSIPTTSVRSIEIHLEDRRVDTRRAVRLSSTSVTSVEVTATERWSIAPPCALSCPGGSVSFGGDDLEVSVERIDCEDGWEATEITQHFNRGAHRRGATFSTGTDVWHVAMCGYDGESAPKAELGRRWTVSR